MILYRKRGAAARPSPPPAYSRDLNRRVAAPPRQKPRLWLHVLLLRHDAVHDDARGRAHAVQLHATICRFSISNSYLGYFHRRAAEPGALLLGTAVFAHAADDPDGARTRALCGLRLLRRGCDAALLPAGARLRSPARWALSFASARRFTASASCSISALPDLLPASCSWFRRSGVGLAFSKVIPGINHQGTIQLGAPALQWILQRIDLPRRSVRGYLSASGGARRVGGDVRDRAESAARSASWMAAISSMRCWAARTNGSHRRSCCACCPWANSGTAGGSGLCCCSSSRASIRPFTIGRKSATSALKLGFLALVVFLLCFSFAPIID